MLGASEAVITHAGRAQRYGPACDGKTSTMYIGVGTIVVILIVVALVLVLRRR
jgi:hypothetical protein